jgi:hypothetical protein
MLLKLADEETVETVRAGMADKELHPLNMLFMFPTFAVLNSGIACKQLQF